MLVFKDYVVKFEIFITFFEEKYEQIGEKMMRKKSLLLEWVIIISFIKCTYPPADIVWTS